MASTTSQIGYGATVTFAGFSGEVLSIDGMALQRSSVEATHMLSADGWKEKIPGMPDAGSTTIEAAFGASTAPIINSAAATLTLTWPVEAAKTVGATWACTSFVTAQKPGSITPDGRMTCSFTFEHTGKPTFTAGS